MNDQSTEYRKGLIDNMLAMSASEPHKVAGVRARLDASFLEEVGELVGNLASEVKQHREVIDRAAASAESSGREMAALTRALVRATTYYVMLTGGLLLVGGLNLICARPTVVQLSVPPAISAAPASR